MENYYEQLLKEIDEAIEKKEYEEALYLLKKEFKMPYIPGDIEKELNERYKTVQFYMHDKEEEQTASLDHLLELLHGDARAQLSAVSQLGKVNLRDCIEEIQDYLQSDPYEDAAAFLIECIAEQEIPDEFTWNRNGVEYTFYGDSVTPCSESKGFQKANAYLQEWFDKNVDMYTLAKTLLTHRVYMFLPLSYEEAEAEALAFEIFEDICKMMGQDQLLSEVKSKMKGSLLS